MAQPATGATWTTGHFNDIDPRLIKRGGLQCVLVRDDLGEATDLSPFSAFAGATYETATKTVAFSPFALDHSLRDDLIAGYMSGGEWIKNASANEGFLSIGSQTEDGGAETNPTISSDDLKILQSIYPVDSTITEKSISINFKATERMKPLVRHLEADMPLCDASGDIILPELGAENYVVSTPVESPQIERQILLVYKSIVKGLDLYQVDGFATTKLDNQAAAKRSKTDPDVSDLTFKNLLNPYFMGPVFNRLTGAWELQPITTAHWIGGPAWAEFGPSGS